MKLDRQLVLFLKYNHQMLVDIGIPLEVLENHKKWSFFLQKGWDIEIGWHYNLELSKDKQIELYNILKSNHIKSCLRNEIAQKYNLVNE